jgi:hypothetical protein
VLFFFPFFLRLGLHACVHDAELLEYRPPWMKEAKRKCLFICKSMHGNALGHLGSSGFYILCKNLQLEMLAMAMHLGAALYAQRVAAPISLMLGKHRMIAVLGNSLTFIFPGLF